MSLFWGVDSFNSVKLEVQVPSAFLRPGERPPVRESIFEYVKRRAGRAPDFWGRYLSRTLPNRLMPDEPAFLFEHQCRLALIYNGVRSAPGPHSTRSAGEAAAQDAIDLAWHHYHVPGYVRIYLDLEWWDATPDFLEGWSETMFASRYSGAGGLYGRGAEVRTLPHSYMPNIHGSIHSSGWARRVPRAEDQNGNLHSTELISDLASGRTGKVYSRFAWSNTPRLYDKNSDTPAGAQLIPERFGAVGPVGALLTDTVVWQYRFSAFWPVGAHIGVVDLDLAREGAFNEMWRG